MAAFRASLGRAAEKRQAAAVLRDQADEIDGLQRRAAAALETMRAAAGVPHDGEDGGRRLVNATDVEVALSRASANAALAGRRLLHDEKATFDAWIDTLIAQISPGDASADGLHAHGLLSNHDVKARINAALERHASDGVGFADYAAARRGATVVHAAGHTSPSYVESLPLQNRLLHKVGLSKYGDQPEVVISHRVLLGRCWAFQGARGRLTVQLAVPVAPTHVTLEHVDERIAYDVSSAPRRFAVLGCVKGGGVGAAAAASTAAAATTTAPPAAATSRAAVATSTTLLY